MMLNKDDYLISLEIMLKRYELQGMTPLELELFVEAEVERIKPMTQEEFVACVLSTI